MSLQHRGPLLPYIQTASQLESGLITITITELNITLLATKCFGWRFDVAHVRRTCCFSSAYDNQTMTVFTSANSLICFCCCCFFRGATPFSGDVAESSDSS